MRALAAILLCATLLPASSAKERRLNVEYDNVAARASALLELVDHLDAGLRQQGLALNPEIAASRNGLTAAMTSASEALERRDWNELRKSLDRARGWIDRLQRQL
jgi:hypothetical protein